MGVHLWGEASTELHSDRAHGRGQPRLSPLYVNPANGFISKRINQKQVVDPVIEERYREVTSEGLERSGRRADARATERSGNLERKSMSRPVCMRTHRQARMIVVNPDSPGGCVWAGREKPPATRLAYPNVFLADLTL